MKLLLRSFSFSLVVSIVAFTFVFRFLGPGAGLIALILAAIELAFSFDNAVINARVLGKLSTFWRDLFLTLGIVIAIFVVRALLPIVIVSVSSQLSMGAVVDLVLHRPQIYAQELAFAHPLIAAFGGAFLLMLSLHFFMAERDIHWIRVIERPLSRYARWYLPLLLTIAGLCLIAFLLGGGPTGAAVLLAGLAGALSYAALQAVIRLIEKLFGVEVGVTRTSWAALATFIYLEVLDASLSFDGVLGAFAITSDVLLIAVGLGVGAIWVRSLTVYMVRQRTLEAYKYLEHGAHYAITVLALTMLLSLLVPISDFITGVLCLGLIIAAILASREAVEARL